MSGINYIELLICVGLLIFLCRLEWRAKRPRLSGRVVAAVLAVAALAGLILPLSYRHRAAEAARGAGPVRTALAKEGIVSAGWRWRLYPGDPLVVQGRWKSGMGPVKLFLTGFGAVLDSAAVDGEFSLTTVPAQAGRAVYGLVAVRGADTIEREDIPVETIGGRPLRVLILTTSPDFEIRFLADWLEKSGQQAAVRTLVSKERYETSFVNMKKRSLERLTAPMLDGFDVVIADEALSLAAPGEWGLIRRVVDEKGVGLIIRADSQVIGRKPGIRIMAVDSLARPVVGSRLAGLGKVIYTGLNTTYVRKMAGEPAGYASYWSGLMRLAGKRGAAGDEWEWRPRISRVGEEIDLGLRTGDAIPQGIVMKDGRATSVYLAEDAMLSYRWTGRYWPDSAGWAVINDSNWLYVWPRGSWRAMVWPGQGEVGSGPDDEGTARGRPVSAREIVAMVPKSWMYTILLLSVFFLWVEKKIF